MPVMVMSFEMVVGRVRGRSPSTGPCSSSGHGWHLHLVRTRGPAGCRRFADRPVRGRPRRESLLPVIPRDNRPDWSNTRRRMGFNMRRRESIRVRQWPLAGNALPDGDHGPEHRDRAESADSVNWDAIAQCESAAIGRSTPVTVSMAAQNSARHLGANGGVGSSGPRHARAADPPRRAVLASRGLAGCPRQQRRLRCSGPIAPPAWSNTGTTPAFGGSGNDATPGTPASTCWYSANARLSPRRQ